MLLDDHQKKTFVRYLQIERDSAEGIIEQMKKQKSPVMDILIDQNRKLVYACSILIERLQSGETMQMGPG